MARKATGKAACKATDKATDKATGSPRESPFATLPPELQSRIAAFTRSLPGYWTTNELAALQNIGRMAVTMQVCKGNLSPVNRTQGQQSMFTDIEVARYLGRKRKIGRPKNVKNTDC